MGLRHLMGTLPSSLDCYECRERKVEGEVASFIVDLCPIPCPLCMVIWHGKKPGGHRWEHPFCSSSSLFTNLARGRWRSLLVWNSLSLCCYHGVSGSWEGRGRAFNIKAPPPRFLTYIKGRVIMTPPLLTCYIFKNIFHVIWLSPGFIASMHAWVPLCEHSSSSSHAQPYT